MNSRLRTPKYPLAWLSIYPRAQLRFSILPDFFPLALDILTIFAHMNPIPHFSALWKRLRPVTGLMAFEKKRTLDAGLFAFIEVSNFSGASGAFFFFIKNSTTTQ